LPPIGPLPQEHCTAKPRCLAVYPEQHPPIVGCHCRIPGPVARIWVPIGEAEETVPPAPLVPIRGVGGRGPTLEIPRQNPNRLRCLARGNQTIWTKPNTNSKL